VREIGRKPLYAAAGVLANVAEVDPVRASVIASMVIVLAGVAYLEIRMIRSRRRKREARGEVPDRAHNALLSVKAIAEALGHGGVRSVEADDLILEAETALKNRNYRVALDLSDRAKGLLRTEKARHQAKGDLSKLETTGPSRDSEPTTKEKLTKDLPPNYMQAKFSMNLAHDEIDAARSRGQDVTEAQRMLGEAQATFDAKDYTAALGQASRARRSLEVTTTVSPPQGTTKVSPPIAATPPAPAPTPSVSTSRTRPCPNCSAAVAVEDTFCRTCGAKVPFARTCPSCGTEVASDDAFCRKCGTKVP